MDEICRLCLADTTTCDEYTSYNQKIQLLMPEIDLNITPTVILCEDCSDTLNNAYTFKQKCLQIEEHIKNYISKTRTTLINLRWVRDHNFNDKNKSFNEVKVKVEYDNDFNNDRITDLTKLSDFKDINSIEEEFNLTVPKVEIFLQEEIVENESLNAFVCGICTESFKNSIELDRHRIAHSEINQLQDDYGEKDPLILPNQDIVKCHITEYATNQCVKEESEICKESFKKSIELDQHHRNIHSKSDSYNKTLPSNKKIRHFCDICNKGFNRKQNLDYHKDGHNNKMHTCSICSKSYRNLHNHMKAVHMKKHACKFCDMKFGIKSRLLSHMQTHTGDRPYVCEICGKGFAQKVTLTVHVRLHRREKPYLCNICQKSYISKVSLEAHMDVHVLDPEKPFVCKIMTCKRGFKTRVGLVRHMRRHQLENTHPCYLCDKSFSTSTHLDTHMRFHSGERPYECGTCHKRFAGKTHLGRHLKTHRSKEI